MHPGTFQASSKIQTIIKKASWKQVSSAIKNQIKALESKPKI